MPNYLSGILHYKSKTVHRVQRLIDPLLVIIFYNIFNTIDIQKNSLSKDYLLTYLVLFFSVYIIFNNFGVYESFRQKSLWFLVTRISTCWAVTIFSSILLNNIFSLKLDISSEKSLSWIFISWLSLIATNLAIRLILKFHRIKGGNRKKAIFWGEICDAKEFYKQLRSQKSLGIELVAWFSPSKPNQEYENNFVTKYSGNIYDMKTWLNENTIDKVFFSEIHDEEHNTEKILKIFGDTYREVIYIPPWAKTYMKFSLSFVGNKPCLNIWDSTTTLDVIDGLIKRTFDLFFSIFGIISFSPLFLFIAILIKIDSKGPVFFEQERYGLYGRKFRIKKFRTMKVLESGSLTELKQATKNDSRITNIGIFLRKWSLDELPQLINVLKGEMSLVGPRPHAVSHNESYRKLILGYMQRHTLKPGMTGLAQIEGYRGETKTTADMAKRIDADLRYKRDWSIFLDIVIIINTIIKIKSEKAY